METKARVEAEVAVAIIITIRRKVVAHPPEGKAHPQKGKVRPPNGKRVRAHLPKEKRKERGESGGEKERAEEGTVRKITMWSEEDKNEEKEESA